MKKFLSVALLGSVAASGVVSAHEEAAQNPYYTIFGGTYLFSKIGFNNAKNVPAQGKYKTDSWGSFAMELGVKGNVEGFLYGLGGMISAPFWDPDKYSFAYINGTNNQAWNKSASNLSVDAINGNYYVLATAYLGYEYKSDALDARVKIGRFDDHGLDWFSAFSEGVELRAGNDLVKGQINFITRRGLAYNQWFYDYYFVGGANGKDFGYFLVGTVDVNFAGFNLRPQVQYHRNDYTAPGLSASYSFGDEFKSTTSLLTTFAISEKKNGAYTNGTANSLGTILILKEDMSYAGWNFGLGLWKNIGNPGANIGNYGNKSGLDLWTGTVADNSWALNNINARDAFSGWLYGGQTYESSFWWKILARVTTAKPADEQSVALSFGYSFTKRFSAWAKVEWQNVSQKAYAGKPKATNDRSHAFLSLDYKF